MEQEHHLESALADAAQQRLMFEETLAEVKGVDRFCVQWCLVPMVPLTALNQLQEEPVIEFDVGGDLFQSDHVYPLQISGLRAFLWRFYDQPHNTIHQNEVWFRMGRWGCICLSLGVNGLRLNHHGVHEESRVFHDFGSCIRLLWWR